MAAHAEKVIVNADAVHVQKPGPEVGEELFDLRAWLHVGSSFSMKVGVRQSAAIDLAVGGQSKLVYQHERSGHHVFWQAIR